MTLNYANIFYDILIEMGTLYIITSDWGDIWVKVLGGISLNTDSIRCKDRDK